VVAAPTVLILAAGQGTRMRSRTPKVLHDLCGVPMIAWPVRAAREAGAGRMVVVDSPQRALQSVLEDGVELAVQERPDGTGGAVLAALAHLRASAKRARPAGPEGPVIVLSGDVPLLGAESIRLLGEAHARAGAAATVATTTLADPSGYGRVVRDPSGAFERVVETKAEGDATQQEGEIREVNTGVYVFDATALEEFLPRLTADNAQGELYLPQVLALMRSAGRKVAAQEVSDPTIVLGVNDRVALARVRKLAQATICERHMTAGVTIVDPDSTVIDVQVEIGSDTVIEPFTTIRGDTRIGAGCVVRHSYLIDCTLEDGVSVGPFAYLRPGTLLRADAKIGTFVEVKNSDIGAQAKVPHLSYIGDASVGEQSNLGAGSITANYDGRAKHRTTIGSRVHGGVDTSYVAPVEVGDDSYTAAGSVITEDVPPGSLAVARARQENIADYAGPAPKDPGDAGLHSEEP
jgi:bifunctional UDP-N-acetylglucosamine pyrophosphorylase / glucosamine-1-phosphate N-acetyltransferase